MKHEDFCKYSGYFFLHPFRLACYQYGLPEIELRLDSEKELLGMAIKDDSPQSAVIACCCYYFVTMRPATRSEFWTWGNKLDDYPMQKAAVEWLKKQFPGGHFPEQRCFEDIIYAKDFRKLIENHDFFWMHPDLILKSKKNGYYVLQKCEDLAEKTAELKPINPYTTMIQLALNLDYTDEAAEAFIPSLRLLLSDVEEYRRRDLVAEKRAKQK